MTPFDDNCRRRFLVRGNPFCHTVRNAAADDSNRCMATDKQIIIDECMAAVSQYCCCDADASSRRDSVYYLDFVDIYEICLDVAQRVKGERMLAWDEFLEISDCVFDSS